MFSKTLFINLMLITLILLGVWYTWQQLIRPPHSLTIPHQPDAYATHVIIFHTDTTGRLYNQLKTPLLIHYPLADSLFLFSPVFDLFLKNNESWQLSSHYGKLKEDKDLLQLWGHVKLDQKKGLAAHATATLTTSLLNINLKEKTAQTPAPVTVTQGNQVIHATGLYTDFKTKTVQLLSQVKGQLKSTKK